MAKDLETALGVLRTTNEQAVSLLDEFVRLPSVSNEPGYDEAVEEAAAWIALKLLQAGAPKCSLIQVPKKGGSGVHNPIVVTKYSGAGPTKPTVLIYFHYDVQAGGDGWTVAHPFGPEIIDGKIYGRGVGDNKGPAIAIVQALRAICNDDGNFPINFVILAEGEEEAGGGGIELFVRNPGEYGNFADLFDNVSCALVADVEMADEKQPGLVYGLRGLVYYKLSVFGPGVTCHSGLKGGIVQDPAEALAKMIGAVRNPQTGDIRIPGFMNGAFLLTDADRERLGACPVDEDSCGAPAIMRYDGRSLAEQIGAMPTFTVHALCSGHVDDSQIAAGTPTKIFRDAHALCSNRLIAGQDPENVVKSLRTFFAGYAANELRGTVTVELEVLKASKAVAFNPSARAIMLAADAMAAAWKQPVGMGMSGGSIPIVQTFVDELGIPVVLWGGTDVNCGMHGPDEHLSLENFHRSAEGMVRYFYLLAGLS